MYTTKKVSPINSVNKIFECSETFSGHGSLKNSYCLIVFFLRNEQCSAMEVTLSKKLAVWVREMLFFIDWVESNDALPDCMPSGNKKCKGKLFSFASELQ